MRLGASIVTSLAVAAMVSAAGHATASTNCNRTFTSGEGSSKFEWCYSDDGNIVRLEHPDGVEHINSGVITEGWCISANGTKRGQTNGSAANVTLLPAKASGKKVRHDTADGSLRIEQSFKETKSRRDSEVNIEITMKVKNLSDTPLTSVFLSRFVDADVNSTTGSDVWVTASRSVSVSEPGAARLDLIPTTRGNVANSMIYPSFSPVNNEFCYDPASDSTTEATAGDRSMGVLYQLGTIERRKTKTVKFVYRIHN